MTHNAMPLQVGGNSSAELYASAREQVSRGKRFDPKILEDVKHSSAIWIHLYPKVEVNALASELSYVLTVNKQAISNASKILFPEGFTRVANRMGKGVQACARLQFARESFTQKI